MKREKPIAIKEPKAEVKAKAVKVKEQDEEPKVVKNEPLRWRKIGGGSMRILGKIIKPNQVFTATIEQIPQGFRNSVVCLDQEELKKQVKAGKIMFTNKEDLYGIEEAGKTGLYNIINKKTGKPLTKKPQEKSEAIVLASSLNG